MADVRLAKLSEVLAKVLGKVLAEVLVEGLAEVSGSLRKSVELIAERQFISCKISGVAVWGLTSVKHH